MKDKMKFNHDAESLAGALDVSQHEYASQLAAVLTISMDRGEQKVSRISEMIHSTVDYKIILLLATRNLMDLVEGFDPFNDSFNNLSNN